MVSRSSKREKGRPFGERRCPFPPGRLLRFVCPVLGSFYVSPCSAFFSFSFAGMEFRATFLLPRWQPSFRPDVTRILRHEPPRQVASMGFVLCNIHFLYLSPHWMKNRSLRLSLFIDRYRKSGSPDFKTASCRRAAIRSRKQNSSPLLLRQALSFYPPVMFCSPNFYSVSS